MALEFYHQHQLFAASSVDISQGQVVSHWIEQVVDSSRYFVLKIQGDGGREALIGFGFRDREQATDLRESLQHYEKSIQREKEAAKKSISGSCSIPKLAENEKIRVSKSGKSSVVKKESTKSSGGAVPLLSKKPPPPSSPETVEKPKAPKERSAVEKIAISLENVDLDADHEEAGDDSEGSDGAVFTGSEEQWATEFDAK